MILPVQGASTALQCVALEAVPPFDCEIRCDASVWGREGRITPPPDTHTHTDRRTDGHALTLRAPEGSVCRAEKMPRQHTEV